MSIFPEDFLNQHGYFKGCKSEATHYSTYGTVEELIKLVDGQPYYWNGKYWCESGLGADQITSLGQAEPNFKCGARQPAPPKPDYWAYTAPISKEPEYYLSNRGHYVGD